MTSTTKTEPQPHSETSNDDLWRMRQEAEDVEDKSRKARHLVEDELFSRFDESEATRIVLSSGHIDITYASPHWDAPTLIQLGTELIERAMITEEAWGLVVSWVPKINGTRLKGLRKLGKDIEDRIDRCQIGATGRPQLKGPTLKEMEG